MQIEIFNKVLVFFWILGGLVWLGGVISIMTELIRNRGTKLAKVRARTGSEQSVRYNEHRRSIESYDKCAGDHTKSNTHYNNKDRDIFIEEKLLKNYDPLISFIK